MYSRSIKRHRVNVVLVKYLTFPDKSFDIQKPTRQTVKNDTMSLMSIACLNRLELSHAYMHTTPGRFNACIVDACMQCTMPACIVPCLHCIVYAYMYCTCLNCIVHAYIVLHMPTLYCTCLYLLYMPTCIAHAYMYCTHLHVLYMTACIVHTYYVMYMSTCIVHTYYVLYMST